MIEITVHHHFHNAPGDNGEVLRLLRQLLAQGQTNMTATAADIKAQADQVVAAVKDESDKDDAIILLVEGNTALLTSLKQQLADAIAANDPVALQAALDALTAAESSALSNSAKVLAAVNAGTT